MRSNYCLIHLVVWPGGVLEVIKAEHKSDVSDIFSGGDCNVNVGCNLRTRTCTLYNNINDEEINGKLSTDSTCGLSTTQFKRHDGALEVQEIASK